MTFEHMPLAQTRWAKAEPIVPQAAELFYVFNPALLTQSNLLGNQAANSLDQVQLYKHLEAEVAQHTAAEQQAERARQEAEQRRLVWLQSLGKVLKHELANKLAGIRTSHELIQNAAADNPSLQKYIARAEQSLNDIDTLLDSVIEASSLEAALSNTTHQRLNLSELITTSVEEYSLIYSGHTLELDCEAGITVLGSAYQLRLLLDKLVNNAIEHAAPDTAIEVQLKRKQAWIELTVSDRGDVLPSDHTRLFELFVSTSKNKTEHYGLGLYVANLITEAHDGHIIAESLDDPPGAIFTVRLPLYESKDH